MGPNLSNSLLRNFVCASLGGMDKIRVKSPNLWEKYEFK
jgi:hypothetical protein